MNILLCILVLQIPYPDQPNWESMDNDYATGGALVDVDLDGDIDLVTGNGNDMDMDPNRVYYNYDDTLEQVASWSSSDLGYNAHISVGDINYDGFPELAVANYGDPYTPQYDKLYLNQNGIYESTASWQPDDYDNSFACAFGDMDCDGDLDLAVACGEDYGGSAQSAKVYINNNGTLETTLAWQSNIQSYFYDVSWVDIDADGDLDLFLAAMHDKNLIYLNNGGILASNPSWESINVLGTLKCAFGDVDLDGDQDLVCANNAQTGGTSNCELYLNTGVILDTLPSWTSQNQTYYSCVTLGDVDRDGDLDLSAGGWWESVKVFENSGGTFPQTPSWEWITPNPYDLVCENICFGDVDNTLPSSVVGEMHLIDDSDHVFYLNNRWIREINRVRTSTRELNPDEYCFSYIDGWISVIDTISQQETLYVDYSFSHDLDLVVTNWQEFTGNFLFLNTTGSALREVVTKTIKNDFGISSPNRGNFSINIELRAPLVVVHNVLGQVICRQRDLNVSIDKAGIYFINVYEDLQLCGTQKIVVVH